MYKRLRDESDREYAIRIARLQKKPLPASLDVDSGAEAGRESAEEDAAGRNERTRRKRDKGSTPEPPRTKRVPKGWWKGRARLRDWRNVLGAAALAGFPPQAVDRAARRCADLFGQSMELRTLTEGPVGQGGGIRTTRYVPGMPRPSLLDPEDEESEPPPRTARASSVAATAAEATTSEGERDRRSSSARGRSRSASRTNKNNMRSRSRSASAPGTHFCTFDGCPRAVEGFSRRQNLLRHLRLVHGFGGDGLSAGVGEDEVDSEDEMHGGVHVDGFLKPIKIRPGWRGPGVAAAAAAAAAAVAVAAAAEEEQDRGRWKAEAGFESRRRKRRGRTRPRKGSVSGEMDGGGGGGESDGW